MSKSILRRLTSAMWLLSAVSCITAAGLATFLILRNSEIQAKNRIKVEENNLVSLGLIDLISLNNFRELVPRIPETLEGGERLNETIRIYEPPGKLLFTNRKSADIARIAVDRKALVDKDFYVLEGRTHQYLALLRSYQAFDGDMLWIEILTQRTTPIAILQQITVHFLIALTILLLLSYFIARAVTRSTLFPLRRMAVGMDRLDVHQFKAWEPFSLEHQPKEFQPIVRKVNELIIRIQNAFLKFHQLGQFVAHEVRTPLTVIQGEIENALASPDLKKEEYDETLRSCMDEVSRIDEIVATVLRVSAQDGKVRPYAPETIDLGPFLRELLANCERYTGRTLEFDPGDASAPSIFADRELLTLLLSNLLRNVAKHTPLHTKAHVHCSAQSSSETAIEIADEGPGLSPELLAAANSHQLGEEFLGIGLSLCRQIANISHLKLEFSNRPEGGLLARISCPTAPIAG